MRSGLPALFLAVLAAAGAFHSLTGRVSAAQDDRGLTVNKSAPGERRVALVIGNSAYQNSPLLNPANDARDMAATLRVLGFEVIEGENLSQREMENYIRLFGSKIRDGGVGLFYYAGHAIQINGINYLVPVGATITIEQEVKYESVDVGLVLAQMESARNGLNIVILDACRNNPFARSFRSASQGLASMDAPRGTLIAYATSPGSTARDGDGRNGTYTEELLRSIRVPGLSIEQVFKKVRVAVVGRTNGSQTPWESSSLVGDFYFSAATPSRTMPAVSRLLETLSDSNIDVVDTVTLGGNLYVLYTERLLNGRWLENPDGTRFLQCNVNVAMIDGQKNLRTLKLDTIYGFNTWPDRSNIGISRTHGAVDADAKQISVFVTEKEDSPNYAMIGLLYRVNPLLTSAKKEVVFKGSNMGWFPTMKNGVVSHFSFAGFWSFVGLQQMENSSPDDARAAYSKYRLGKIGVVSDRSPSEYSSLAVRFISKWE
jgi:hypothetical protein